MNEFLKALGSNWEIVKNAPIAFLILAGGLTFLAYMASKWRYTSIIDSLKQSIELHKERLIQKSEQMEVYKERALKIDEKVVELVSSDAEELAKKALKFVESIRDFIDRRKREGSVLSTRGMRATANSTDQDRDREWSKMIEETVAQSNETGAEWDRRFKVEAIMLRDEISTRLDNSQHFGSRPSVYEHSVNFFGYAEIADDLERKAKMLLK
ncbi:hypothetical protein [Pseudomonas syringae]|uniref:hypothetical protein n=1 Tax=Pseudomonas syringae TaxID=317 RepID=UPI0018E6257F|nr:hypothetical protein [Pseudomonas syringae]MBI6795726.1 hypothetical protein [Pseudomonas syringae]